MADDEAQVHGIPAAVFHRRWAILGLLCMSLMIVIIGNTSLNVALPALARDLGADSASLQWMVDAYSLVFAGLLLTAGALGDRFGRKGALQFGLGLFAASSLGASFATTASQVVAARAVMGFAGAFIMPSTLSILTNVFPRHERPKAIAIWAGISGGGAALGPIASGLLLEHYWWGSVFLVNLPVIAVALFVGRTLLPKSSDPSHAPLDPVGAVLSIVGLSALVYAIIEGPHHGWLSTESLAVFGLAGAVLAVFGWWEHRSASPMLELSFFADRRFSVSSGGITLTFFAMFGVLFLLSQYFQLVLGYSALGTGVRLLPMSVAMMAIAPQTPKLVVRFGAQWVAGGGLLVLATGLGLFSLTGTDTSYLQVVGTAMTLSVGMALTMSPMTTQLMSAVPPAKAGVGSAMNDTTRELGGALGVAVLGALVASRYAASLGPALAGLPDAARAQADSGLTGAIQLAAPGSGVSAEVAATVADAARQAFVDGLGLAALVGSAVVAVAAVAVLRLMPSERHPTPAGTGAAEVDDEPVPAGVSD